MYYCVYIVCIILFSILPFIWWHITEEINPFNFKVFKIHLFRGHEIFFGISFIFNLRITLYLYGLTLITLFSVIILFIIAKLVFKFYQLINKTEFFLPYLYNDFKHNFFIFNFNFNEDTCFNTLILFGYSSIYILWNLLINEFNLPDFPLSLNLIDLYFLLILFFCLTILIRFYHFAFIDIFYNKYIYAPYNSNDLMTVLFYLIKDKILTFFIPSGMLIFFIENFSFDSFLFNLYDKFCDFPEFVLMLKIIMPILILFFPLVIFISLFLKSLKTEHSAIFKYIYHAEGNPSNDKKKNLLIYGIHIVH